MENEIYKKMPILNTLGIDVNKYATDNNALQFAKALTKIATGVAENYKTSEFNSKVAQINDLELKFKNEVLVNKDIDLQDPVKREEIFKKANEITELQKQIILEHKYLDNTDIQKLEGILIKSTGERAFNLQNDTNKIMIQQNIDNAIANNGEMFKQMREVGRDGDKSTMYDVTMSNLEILKTNGMAEPQLVKTVFDDLIKAEVYGENEYLQNKLFSKTISYEKIITEFEDWKKEVTSDDFLNRKVEQITQNFKGTEAEKENVKRYLRASLTVGYKDEITKLTPYVMEQYAKEQERKLQQEYAEKNYQLGVATLAEEKKKNAQSQAIRLVDSGNALELLRMGTGVPYNLRDIYSKNNFQMLTEQDFEEAYRTGGFINVFSSERLSVLKNAKSIAYETGNGLPEVFTSYFKGEIDSFRNKKEKEMYARNLAKQGLMPYGLTQMYINSDPDFDRAMNMVSLIEKHTGASESGDNINRLDITGMNNNLFKENITAKGLTNTQQQQLSNLITAWGNSGMLPQGVIIKNGSEFSRNVRDAYITNSTFRNMVDSNIRIIQKLDKQNSYLDFREIPLSNYLVEKIGNDAYNSANSKAMINRTGGSREKPGTVEVRQGNTNNKNKGGGKQGVQKVDAGTSYFNSVR
jgi:hypothetical protein